MTAKALLTPKDTASALETLVAGAERDLCLTLPVLDPFMPLTREDLRSDGMETWADLIASVSQRGVALRILVADLDPVVCTDAHRRAWLLASAFADVVQGDAQVQCAPHGQTAGLAWQWYMRGTVKRLISARSDTDPHLRTPVERGTPVPGAILRPVGQGQAFATADGRHAVLGGIAIEAFPTKGPTANLAVALDSPDFAAALNIHFAECWNAGATIAGTGLTGPLTAIPTKRRSQSPADMRLLKTLSLPDTGFAKLSPKTRNHDIATAITRIAKGAAQFLYVETPAFTFEPLVVALVEAARAKPDLQVVMVAPLAPENTGFAAAVDASAMLQKLQVSAFQRLRQAFGDRIALVAPNPGDDLGLRLNGTLCVADCASSIIGSAALTDRALLWDSEVAVHLRDAPFSEDLMMKRAGFWLRDATSEALVNVAPWANEAVDGKTATRPGKLVKHPNAPRGHSVPRRLYPRGFF